jgi:hypothetical protein
MKPGGSMPPNNPILTQVYNKAGPKMKKFQRVDISTPHNHSLICRLINMNIEFEILFQFLTGPSF